MQKLSIILLFVISIILSANPANAQKNSISKTSVERILRELSADDKRGRPSMDPNVMESSIVFIEKEFKRIGLAPLDGLKSFRQEFSQDMVSGTTVKAMINNNPVAVQNIFAFTSSENLSLDSSVPVQRVKNKDNAFQLIRRFMQDTTNAVVLIDTAHTRIFQSMQSRFAKQRILNSTVKSGTKVFILSTDTLLSSFSAQIVQKKEKLKLTNVVGQIKAQSQTRESVIFSGHYDHLGIQPAIDGDSIANGADDDASGTTAVITLAEHFKKDKGLKRNLIFVAFTAEEIGGYGARYFSSNLNPADIIAMFNIEMIGKLSKWGANAAFITGFERSDFGKILQSNLKGSQFTFNPDPYPAQNLFYRSDNATLARLGVPAHTISTDQIDTDKLYHTVNDEFESIDTNNMTEVIKAIALSATSIVKGDAKPTRIDASKVE